jgi:hypothetical protein
MGIFRIRYLAVVLALLLLAGAPPALADDTVCRGTIGAVTLDNVVVPDGAACTLEGTRVEGNVFVETGATLQADRVAVDGNIQAVGHALVVVRPESTVGGSIQIKQGQSARVEQVRINGNLQLEQNNGSFTLTDNIIGGNLQANQNTGSGLAVERNRIDGNLQCQANHPPPTGGGNVAASLEDQCEDLSGPSPSPGNFRAFIPIVG